MYSEKRDVLITYALDFGQKACKVQAQKMISGFIPTPPSGFQSLYAEKQKIWMYQMDICDYYRQIVNSYKYPGNTVQTKRYFMMKYPHQITDWDKELR